LNEHVFVDTGAWVAIALAGDRHHVEAGVLLSELLSKRARLTTSVAVVVETFTHLQRKVSPDFAVAWRPTLTRMPKLEVLDCTAADLASAWVWFERRELHKLGIVDATSFVLMKKHKLKRAFGFDVHFVTAGFQLIHS